MWGVLPLQSQFKSALPAPLRADFSCLYRTESGSVFQGHMAEHNQVTKAYQGTCCQLKDRKRC